MQRMDLSVFDGITSGRWVARISWKRCADPGGWHADHDSADISGYMAIRQDGKEGGESVIALVVESTCEADSVPIDTEMEANARAIAALPDLIAEVKALRAELDRAASPT